MNMQLFQEIFELNKAFERVIEGLKRMEKVTLFLPEAARETRAEVVFVQVDFNRQFFDKFDEVFEKDAGWAGEFTNECREKRIDPDVVFLEIRRREEVRRKKGLPPSVTLLPDWDMGDERRYDEDQAERRKQTAKKCRNKGRKQQPKADQGSKPAATGVGATPTQGEDSNQ